MNHETWLRDALLDAFPTWESLREVVQDVLGIPLQNYTSETKGMQAVTLDLARWLQAEGRLGDFLKGVRREVPGNARLRAADWMHDLLPLLGGDGAWREAANEIYRKMPLPGLRQRLSGGHSVEGLARHLADIPDWKEEDTRRVPLLDFIYLLAQEVAKSKAQDARPMRAWLTGAAEGLMWTAPGLVPRGAGPRPTELPRGKSDSPLMKLRRLSAGYWKRAATLIALMPALLAILNWLWLPAGQWTEGWVGPVSQWLVMVLGLAILLLIQLRRVEYFITGLIAPPPAPLPLRPRVFRGPKPYKGYDAKQFYGRTEDAGVCWEHIRDNPFFVIEGESGCGKSSLLNVDLLPRAREHFQVVVCRCGDDPFGKLRSALLNEHYEVGRLYDRSALEQTIKRVYQDRKPVFVCIDQFEELFATVPDLLRRLFFEALRDAVAGGQFRLVLAIRTDFSDLLFKGCRDVDPENRAFAFGRESYLTLRAFSANQAEEVLGLMMNRDEIHGGEPLSRQEVTEFVRVLVQQLLRPPLDKRLSPEDEKRVLPVELQMVGWTYESILGGLFSAAELRRRGGKAGLYRAYIEDAKDYVWRKTGVPSATTLLVLRGLISPAGTRQPQCVRDIAAGAALSLSQADKVLSALAERFLLRLLPDERPGAGGPDVGSRRYELMHEHLVQLLTEAPEPQLQRVLDAEARLRFWQERTRYGFAPDAHQPPGTRWGRIRVLWRRLRLLSAQPIPLVETLRLWRYASDGTRQMLRKNLRGVLARSLLGLTLLSVPLIGWNVYVRTDSYQANYVVEYAPVELVNNDRSDLAWSAFHEWLAALVVARRAEAALAAAGKVTDPSTQSRAYAVVAEAAARAGNPELQGAALREAMAAARQATDPWEEYPAYALVAEAATRAGDLEQALAAAGKITEPSVQSRAYAGVAEAAARAGNREQAGAALREALAAAAKLTDPWSRSLAYAGVAEAAARAGNREQAGAALREALEVAGKVTEPHHQSQVYVWVAEAAARAGNREQAGAALREALEAAGKVTEPYFQDRAYAGVAEAAARAGDLEQALAAAGKITEPSVQSRAYAGVAEAAARAGNREQAGAALREALAAAAKLTDPTNQSQAYALVAVAATKAGDLEQALAVAGKITEAFARSSAYAAVAEAAAMASKPELEGAALREALAAAGKVKDPFSQFPAYGAVAEAAARAGNLEQAEAVLREALEAAGKLTDRRHQSRAYTGVAEKAARAGLTKLAQEAEERIPDQSPLSRSSARAAVAQALARTGRLYDARVFCENCQHLEKLWVYTVILTEFTKRSGRSTVSKQQE